jgi:NADH dehydrogenase
LAAIMDANPDPTHHVVIVGGGFGGLRAALALGGAHGVRVTLVDQRNFHLFQPLLYQVATGALSPANIATPLRALVKRQRNTRVVLGEAVGIDAGRRALLLRDGEVAYDTLVVATGSRHHYFGHPEWEAIAPGLKTVEDATRMRRMVLAALEAAEREDDPAQRARLMTFVVVGGGPTAVELAGALAEITRHTVRGEFRRIDPSSVRVLVVEAAERLLAAYPPDLSAKAAAALAALGVEIRTHTRVTGVHPDHVELHGAAGVERVPCACVLWGAGVQASPLGKALAAATGAALDRGGRVAVGPDCSIAGHPEIFVIGDLAGALDHDGKPLPGVAPVAIQQGAYVAGVIRARLAGLPSAPFRYRDRGTMAVIGKRLAVAQVGRWHLSGTIAWLAWLFIHLMELVAFENRLLVLVQWAWNYWTWNRNARLITYDLAPTQPAPAAPAPAALPAPAAAGSAGPLPSSDGR